MTFSRPEVQDLLNRRFVPAHVDNYDFRTLGGAARVPMPSADAQDRALYADIERQERERGLEDRRGPVRGVLLTPEGKVLDSFHVFEIHSPPEFVRRLERALQACPAEPGEPVAPPPDLFAGVRRSPQDVLLRLTSCFTVPPQDVRSYKRYFERRTETGLDGLRVRLQAPAEQGLALSPADQAALVPGGLSRPGGRAAAPDELARRLLMQFVPPTETYVLLPERVRDARLEARVLSDDGDLVRVDLRGRLDMLHPWWGAWWKRPDPKDRRYVLADMEGFLDYRRSAGRTTAFALATVDARYVDPDGCTLPYAAVLRLEP